MLLSFVRKFHSPSVDCEFHYDGINFFLFAEIVLSKQTSTKWKQFLLLLTKHKSVNCRPMHGNEMTCVDCIAWMRTKYN